MAEETDRIEQIRSRRRRAYTGITSDQQQQQQQVRTRAAGTSKVSETKDAGGETVMGVSTQTPWLRDRVSLSLEAQIAMVEMRSSYKLSLADLGYHNRQQITNIRPGIYLKVEPTGCYKMSYHNRM
ncbi:MAG: hypothetical protein LWY06_07455 [Firmicutes bacterium]|nr:hypothetical protein [Bacillota bacterium]